MTGQSDRPAMASASREPLEALPALEHDAIAAIRRAMMLEHCKWDPQVGDVTTLAPFALAIGRDTLTQLFRWTESLAAETQAMERELLQRPELHSKLALPRAVRKVLRRSAGATDKANKHERLPRIMRFDFHWTTEGWCISEVNCDVPGGYTESTHFAALMAEQYASHEATGRPGDVWADAVVHAVAQAGGQVGENRAIALLSATGYMEDTQVVAYMARQLAARGCDVRLANPRQIQWRGTQAFMTEKNTWQPLAAILRFYQGEWLARLGRRAPWRPYFQPPASPTSGTLILNPGSAILTESKRLPLVWDRLQTPVPTWRKLLPRTVDPRDINWWRDDRWVLKSAYCNNGDDVAIRAQLAPKTWRRTQWQVRLRPGAWLAQRRFDAIALDTPLGPMFPCLGVYAIDDKACGIYGRIARKPVIDFEAIDVAVLVQRDEADESAPASPSAAPARSMHLIRHEVGVPD